MKKSNIPEYLALIGALAGAFLGALVEESRSGGRG